MHGTLLTVEPRNDVSVEAGQLHLTFCRHDHAGGTGAVRAIWRVEWRQSCLVAMLERHIYELLRDHREAGGTV